MAVDTPAAFRASVEARLKKEVGPGRGADLNRRRVLMVMERFVARLTAVLPESALLKGGLALELRLDAARTTKDVDVRLLGDRSGLEARLRAVEDLRPDPEDFLVFAIAEDPVHPTLTGDGIKYDGYRFKVKATLAGKPYAAFGLDVAFGDPVHGEPEILEGSSFFDRYGIAPLRVRAYPPASHLAEKLHAYTLPRDRVNTRLKDLVDMPLIGQALEGCVAESVRQAIDLTFRFRGSHPVPASLPPPPRQWLGPYTRLRDVEQLPWADVDELHRVAGSLLDPVLAGLDGTWSATEGTWNPRDES